MRVFPHLCTVAHDHDPPPKHQIHRPSFLTPILNRQARDKHYTNCAKHSTGKQFVARVRRVPPVLDFNDVSRGVTSSGNEMGLVRLWRTTLEGVKFHVSRGIVV
jgi:hypothetical protein